MDRVGTQNGTLVNAQNDNNLRSVSWWFSFDPSPSGNQLAELLF